MLRLREALTALILDADERAITTASITERIREIAGITKRRAVLIARDQIGKLAGRIDHYNQEAAGMASYVWTTAHDERVRPAHKARDGSVFRWNDPPVDGHPGQPTQCRCIADPVLDDEAFGIRPKLGTYTALEEEKQELRAAAQNNILAYADEKAIYDYITAKSYILNDRLRSGAKLTGDLAAMRDALDAALVKMPKYKGDLSRSAYIADTEALDAFVSRFEVGKPICFREYISTTKDKELYNPDGNVQIYIRGAGKGRDISRYNTGEQEVLYERNSVFRVYEKDFVGGIWRIVMVEEN